MGTSIDRHLTNSEKNECTAACVDVLIAARNRADTIERAVESALAQPEVHTVIVVDDGSEDDTASRASRCDLTGKRLIVERLSHNIGPAAARNIAIEISTNPWLAILDGDDFFLPARIGHLLSHSDHWDFIADDVLQLGEDKCGCEPPSVRGFTELSRPQSINLEQFVRGNITRRGVLRRELGFIKPLIRSSFLRRHALRYDEELRLGEDYALYARALALGARFALVPAVGYVASIRPDSLSAQHGREDLERFRDTDCELLAMATLSKPERRALTAHYTSADCRVQWLRVIEGFKARSVKEFSRPFFRSVHVSRYLVRQLASELVERSKRIFRQRVRRAGSMA